MYIKRVHLKNIRCFKDLVIEFDLNGKTPPWTVIVGDNATGKTALLRSIAIGLCDESSAAGLMKESDEGYIRRRETVGLIIIDLIDKNNKRNYRIRTKIEKFKAGKLNYEKVSQTTTPSKNFPWNDIFTCAYGTCRATSGTGDIAGWSNIDAVYNLFNYKEGLQNPELILYRIPEIPKRNRVKEMLGEILFDNKKAIHDRESGIQVDGEWGNDMPLRDLADGFRSSFFWITDFIGWAYAYYKEKFDPSRISGIVLVDELENHLHATWQRKIVHDLRNKFSNVQFIVTTHSPLIASAIGPISDKKIDAGAFGYERDKLIYLELQDENIVTREYLPSLRLRRIDQVLASQAFKYMIDEDPGVERILHTASILAAKRNRSDSEQRRYIRLCKALEPILLPDGQTLIERDIESKRYNEVVKELKELDKKIASPK